ncbi:hypothetical protein H632_c4424p0, partial [Helicosporidium sp. ATCC 50920]
ALQGVKQWCKAGDANVESAWEVLVDRLRASNSQTRLLSLNILAELVSRSKIIRARLASNMTQVLELTVGPRSDCALPPPQASARALRERALECLDAWAASHGAQYSQFVLGQGYARHARLQALEPA